ncbi:MAG: glycosyltransferase [Acidobacteriota bacterium]
MRESPADLDLSIVCAVSRTAGDLAAIHREFREAVLATGRTAEFLYVLDGPDEPIEEAVSRIVETDLALRIFRTARGFGEAPTLQLAFERARGRYVLTIPDRFQADPAAVSRIIEQLDGGHDMVVTRREPRRDAWPNRLQSRVFHALVRRLSGGDFHDMTCALRGMTREVAGQLDLYGDLHRFIPILALRHGFRVAEIPVSQRREDRRLRVFGPGIYARRLLDILNVFFLTRFLRKPLRFFGLAGMGLGFVGFLICAILAVEKVWLGAALANRPLLLLGVLLLILGVQMASIGLIGEIVIFLTARKDTPRIGEVASSDAAGKPDRSRDTVA